MNDICIIAAVAKNSVIGKDNKIPWNIPEDLQHFKELTMGNVIIMGRRTYESIGRPLHGRTTIVVSKKFFEEVKSVPDINSATALAKQTAPGKKIFFCGGEGIYKEALSIADTLYLTEILTCAEGDVKFPEFNKELYKRTVLGENHTQDFTYQFVKYERCC